MRQMLQKTGAFLCGLMVMGLVAVGAVQAITFTTAQSRFDAGVDNQGWWSPTLNNVDDNDIYFTGINGVFSLRNFFTFDLTSLSGTATSATLKVTRAFDSGTNGASETLEFFDVSTDATTLNNNTGTSQTIFDDLGSGTSYGSFAVAGSGPTNEVLSFVLNAQALTDINNAAGGFFSIGGSLTDNDGNDSLFGGSGGSGPAQLDITTGPVNPPAIPEPSTMLLFGSGFAALAAWRHKARRTM